LLAIIREDSHHFRGGLRSVVPSGLLEEEQSAVAAVAIGKALQTEDGESIRYNAKDSNWRVSTCERVRCDAKLLAQYF
jgi:hypothetical protein